MARDRSELFHFETDDLATRLAALSQVELDALPFGVVKLDAEGLVTYFSAAEAAQSGFLRHKALGRDFFGDVAPCMGTPGFRERIARSRIGGRLDVRFEQVGDFADPQRTLVVRVVSDGAGGLWVALKR
ncbi:MAG TPA: PAS domain-containing protein [Polyangiales bacterium]